MKIDLEKHRYALEKILNILGALLYVVFAATYAKDIIHTHRISSIYPLALTSFFIYFFLVRDIPKQLNLSPYDWVITLNGTFLTLYFRPAPHVHDSAPLLMMQCLGICIAIAGLLSLNKSIGLVPANRGVKTFWAYKYVRHPIYAGYFICFIGYFFQNMTPANAVIITLWMTCETLRLFSEEKYLSDDPVYAEYMKKVRWRMFPGIF